MRHKTKIFDLLLFAVLASAVILSGCAGSNNNGSQNTGREVVFEDMKASFDQSNLMPANIGIFSKTEKDGSVSYGDCGSGVIFDRKDGMYYALTCAHVVSAKDAQLLVFTVNTKMEEESIPGIDMKTLSQDTYESMYGAEVVYVSDRDDLAVIRFSSDEDLSVIEIAEDDPEIDDRIMCVGNPQNEWFAISYGNVTSGIEKFGEFKGYPTNGMKHSAYTQVGSSGGAAINEDMKLTGIVPGGSFSLDGTTFEYGVLIPPSEIKLCLDAWGGSLSP